MASIKLLLSQARRHCFTNHPSHFHSSLSHSFFSHNRSFSSSESNPPFQPIPIQPVSYPVKPQDPPPPDSQPSSDAPSLTQPPRAADTPQQPQAWTREEIRYVKDAPSITPVSYPLRVAPLPDDKAPGHNEEMEQERKRIDAEDQLRKKMLKATEDEKLKVPFPLLIKPKQKEKPPLYDLNEAIRQVKANAKAKFDETVEAHIRLGIDSKRTELQVRGTVILPHGAPKAVSVAVFAEGAEAEEAKAAGADIVGGKELIEEIASGNNKLKVDKCFSTPGMAPHLGKIAQYLRKRRLMPDKKLGTLTSDIAGQLKELRQGRIEFKMESKSILHAGVGKVSYKEEALRENIGAFMNAVLQAKPAGLKKTSKYAGYVLSVHICSTIGPGIPVSIQSLSKAADNYKKAHVQVRGTVILPHGAPKAVSVAVFAEGAEAEEAKAAGADIVGGKELIEEIASGNNKLKVDKCFSTPGMAPHLGKIAQYLRKRRLMPDKKLGTLTSDIAGQLKELRQGRIEFKMESKSILHAGVGKVSYKEEALRENIGAFMNAVLQAKPAGLKKTSKYAGYVLSVHICSTIGPGIPVSIQSLSKAADNYKKAHVQVRGTVILPHGAPKAVSVAVFAEGAEAEEAKAAGADIVGGKELIEEIASGNNKLKVDKCFSTPGMAPHLGKIAQYLRKRRLMPDKKLGTLTSDIAGQLKELRQGRIEFKMESKSILHAGVGKVSYKEEALRENIGAFMNAVLQAKPAGLKKTSKYAGYVLSVHICSTIGPGIPVSIQSLSKAADNYKKAHVQVRGTVILPHGAPKAVSVAVFAEGAEAEEAKAAGADIVGGKELIEEIASGNNKLKVDKCFSTPGMAPHLGKIAQYLRKRRLMPDKKLGTLTSDIAGQLKELRQGRIEFKMESKSILHAGVGKVSYKEEALRENIGAFMNAVLQAKPAGLKKTSKYAGYVLSVHICSTIGPGIPVSIQSLSKAADNYKKAHVQVRGTVILPHGAPKAVSVAVFAEGAEAEEAKAAGADIVGGKELIEEIASGNNKLKVDKCFSTPGMAPHLGKIAQYLRKRRLMPDKKLGTLTSDIAGQLKELRQGRIEFKMESKSILHAGVGKVSYKEEALRENIGAFMNAVLQAKPAGLKKTSKYAGYVLSVHICSTIGPGIPVSIQSLSKAADNYKKAHVQVRGTVILPHGAPKAVSVAVFAEGAEAEEAKAAGADIVGGKELIEEIASGNNKLKVDKCFSTPGMAPHLGKIAQYLRKRRLMPDKKLGTLTSDIAGQLKELRQGRIEFKMESKSILHAGVGKVSYKEEALRENIGAFMNAVLQAKPAGLKKTSKYAGYVLSVHICSTIGPGIPVSIQSLSKAADNYKKAHVV